MQMQCGRFCPQEFEIDLNVAKRRPEASKSFYLPADDSEDENPTPRNSWERGAPDKSQHGLKTGAYGMGIGEWEGVVRMLQANRPPGGHP
jgi:hypothetical protein